MLATIFLAIILTIVMVTEAIPGDMPIALHQLVSVDIAGDAVIRLKGWDEKNPKLTYTIKSVPSTGVLYQLSQVYSNHNINPKAGIVLTPEMNVTGSNNRIYYKRPNPDVGTTEKWGDIEFIVNSGRSSNGYTTASNSYKGVVTLTQSTGDLISSNFLLNNDDWTVIGNKMTTSATYEPYSRSASLNHYIIATDDTIHTKTVGTTSTDNSLWYFHAPSRYYRNWGIAYGGKLSFTIGSFSGDFSKLNDGNTPVVELECATCQGPVTKGIRLILDLKTLLSKQHLNTGASSNTAFSIQLNEKSGWLIDPQNTLISKWSKPTKCEMLQVLSRLSSFNILGDWTQWYETVALDNVQISANTNMKTNDKGAVVPLCAMQKPDASVCTC